MTQVRYRGFNTFALEKGLWSERALMITLAEMYLQGVSTLKVKSVTGKGEFVQFHFNSK